MLCQNGTSLCKVIKCKLTNKHLGEVSQVNRVQPVNDVPLCPLDDFLLGERERGQ